MREHANLSKVLKWDAYDRWMTDSPQQASSQEGMLQGAYPRPEFLITDILMKLLKMRDFPKESRP